MRSPCAPFGNPAIRPSVYRVRPAGLRAKRAYNEGVQMNAVDVGGWNANWAWGLLLIVLNVVIHVIGLGLIYERVVHVLSGAMAHRRFMSRFVVVIGIAALLATLLHRIEAANWAAAYRFPGALPDNKSATESGKYGLHIYPSFLIGPLGSTSSRIKGAHDPVH